MIKLNTLHFTVLTETIIKTKIYTNWVNNLNILKIFPNWENKYFEEMRAEWVDLYYKCNAYFPIKHIRTYIIIPFSQVVYTHRTSDMNYSFKEWLKCTFENFIFFVEAQHPFNHNYSYYLNRDTNNLFYKEENISEELLYELDVETYCILAQTRQCKKLYD